MPNSAMMVLLVEDNKDLAATVGDYLEASDITVDYAYDGRSALELSSTGRYDAVILDLGLPHRDGISILRAVRIKKIEIPILILTARDQISDRVTGLDAGADDYITKPIKPKVLVSKVNALLRRIVEDSTNDNVVKIGDLIINREEYKILKGKEEILLPRKEFELLSLLASKPGKVFKREDILDRVWGNEVVVGGRTIDVHIRKLREKLGDKRFKTVKGVGYKFVS